MLSEEVPFDDFSSLSSFFIDVLSFKSLLLTSFFTSATNVESFLLLFVDDFLDDFGLSSVSLLS